MRAAVLHAAPGGVVTEEVQLDAPLADEIVVQTAACGLCHSDLHVMEAALPHPLPAVLGHEAAGVVTAVGADVTEFAIGDHVVCCLSQFCGVCRECQVGHTWLCEQRRAMGRGADQSPRLSHDGAPLHQGAALGGFAEEMLVHRNAAVVIPPDVPLDRAALLGCAVLTGVGSVTNAARVEPGATVAVIGCGGVGLNIVQGALLAGAARIIAVDLMPEKLALATTFGATHTVLADTDDVVGAVLEISNGGVDYSFEAIGLPATAAQAVAMLRPGRTAYLVGVPSAVASIELPGAPMVLQARGLQGVFMGSNQFKRDIPLLADLYLAGRLRLDELVAGHIGLDEINEGYDRMRQGAEARSVVTFDL